MTKEFKRLPLKFGLSKRFLAFLTFLVRLDGILETNTILFLPSDYNLRAFFSVYMVAFPVYRPGHYSWRLVSMHALQCSVGQWILKITQSKMHFHIIFICGLALSLILTFLLFFSVSVQLSLWYQKHFTSVTTLLYPLIQNYRKNVYKYLYMVVKYRKTQLINLIHMQTFVYSFYQTYKVN